MSKVTVAAAQMQIRHHDVAANLLQARILAAQAADDARAGLIVFPEAALTGPVSDAPELIAQAPQLLENWREIARDAGLDLVAGSIVLIDEQGVRRNRTHYIAADGSVLGYHDKARPWKTETPLTGAGSTITVVEGNVGRVGLGVCWDITDPAFIGALAHAGADIVTIPAYWCTALAGPEVRHSLFAEATHVDAMCVSRAFENGIAVVFVNASGDCMPGDPRTPKKLLGRSQVAVPFQGAIARLGDDAGLLVADIDLGLLADARDLYGLGREPLPAPTRP